MTATRVLIIGISAATGTCFAVLAGLSISAIAVPVRRFHVASIVVAAVAIFLGWRAFRAAMAGVTDEKTEETVVAPLKFLPLGFGKHRGQEQTWLTPVPAMRSWRPPSGQQKSYAEKLRRTAPFPRTVASYLRQTGTGD